MNKSLPLLLLLILFACKDKPPVYRGISEALLKSSKDSVIVDSIVYHPVRIDGNGKILPWYSSNPGESYDYVLDKVWRFWKNMALDSNGQRYYLNHQVWSPEHDIRGIGGDQLMMALSSWDLYYNYTGDESIIENMKYMADYYLAHSLTPTNSLWPSLPYPYNMNVETGEYDGDMILGKGYLQPDKAGSFGYELVHLYKKTGEQKYLDAAVKMANTLAEKVQAGDGDHSPWPFKVNAQTGETGFLVSTEVWYEGMDKDVKKQQATAKRSAYTTNWTGALGLFSELTRLKKGDSVAYQHALDLTLNWLKAYPAKTNKWGPFFEDVPRWSDTQINAMTYAMYILEHPELDPNWKQVAGNIISWVYKELGSSQYAKYGVTCIGEQTAYRVAGNSHSSRQAAVDLAYWKLTGDTTRVENAVRMLNWATYMVDADGRNYYPTNAIWLTDGYGDYVRHYLRAMAAAPQLAPGNSNHLLSSSSIIQKIVYQPGSITYRSFDPAGEEQLRLIREPSGVTVGGHPVNNYKENENEGWKWESLPAGGVLHIKRLAGKDVVIKF